MKLKSVSGVAPKQAVSQRTNINMKNRSYFLPAFSITRIY